jgi:hypothetical protein
MKVMASKFGHQLLGYYAEKQPKNTVFVGCRRKMGGDAKTGPLVQAAEVRRELEGGEKLSMRNRRVQL